MAVMEDTFDGEIRVASRIVDYLSSGLYNSAAACLKELVNNSYDADATTVELFVKPDSERILILDDGVGMSKDEFVKHFERVSESHKRDESDTTKSGRPKIGKIGIGFIAANELCDVMEIESTKANSTQLLRVEINFAEMRKPPEERKRAGVDYVKADYVGRVGNAPRDAHYTNVVLTAITDTAKGILAGAREAREHVQGEESVYGKTPRRIRRLVAQAADWGDFDEYSQSMLQVGLNVPVRYLPDWFPADHKSLLAPFQRDVARLKFDVRFDGTELRKPVVLDAGERNLATPIEIDGEHVAARGYFYAKRRALRPQWLNGVLIRIRNAAVGDYDSTFLGFKATEARLFQSWTSCELWADDRLEEALNIDRRTLRITHPAYVELQELFHAQFHSFLGDVREQLYDKPAKTRKREDAEREIGRLTEVIESPGTELRASLRRELTTKRIPADLSSSRTIKAMLRTYTVTEVYELALSVARETLDARDYERFASTLAERLLR